MEFKHCYRLPQASCSLFHCYKLTVCSAKKHHKDFLDYEISVDTLLRWREGNGAQAKNVQHSKMVGVYAMVTENRGLYVGKSAVSLMRRGHAHMAHENAPINAKVKALFGWLIRELTDYELTSRNRSRTMLR